MEALGYNLGKFLETRHIEQAYKLLRLQMDTDAYQFRSLELTIYRKEFGETEFDVKGYYERFIKFDLFYNLPNIFESQFYPFPKTNGGLREYSFLSFHSMILYYALGYYLLEVSATMAEEILQYETILGRISTFYGAKINNQFPEKSEIYYQNDYGTFLERKREFSKSKPGKKIVILNLDVQRFFHSIHHPILIDAFGQSSHESSKKRLKFDTNTVESIRMALHFIQKSDVGIPLSRHNIFSNYLADKYLLQFDNHLIRRLQATKLEFNILRYVDDTLVFIEFPNSISPETTTDIVSEFIESASIFLNENLKLNLNNQKTEVIIVENEDDQEQFWEESVTNATFNSDYDFGQSKPKGELSPSGTKTDLDTKDKIVATSAEEQFGDGPKQRLKEIIKVIESLKSTRLSSQFPKMTREERSTLNEAFGRQMKNYIKSDDAKSLLESAFHAWPPILTSKNIKALLFLFGETHTGLKKVGEFIIQNIDAMEASPTFMNLVEHYLLADGIEDAVKESIMKAQTTSVHLKLMKRMLGSNGTIPQAEFPINEEMLLSSPSIVQQIKLYQLESIEGKSNLAFNHMLNILHYFCYEKYAKAMAVPLKKYDKPAVINSLVSRISPADVHFISNFFDRRNKNSISHPGEGDSAYWPVDQAELLDYKKKMIDLINHLNAN